MPSNSAIADSNDSPESLADSPGGDVARPVDMGLLSGCGGRDKDGDGGHWWGAVKGMARKNTGLLLVASAQAFISLMGLSVKELHAIDGPPISMLQVRSFSLVGTRNVVP